MIGAGVGVAFPKILNKERDMHEFECCVSVETNKEDEVNITRNQQ